MLVLPPVSSSETPVPPGPRKVIESVLEQCLTVVGDAAEALLEVAPASGLARGPLEWDWPRAAVLGALALQSAEQRQKPLRFDPEAVHGLEPIYLRPLEAGRNP